MLTKLQYEYFRIQSSNGKNVIRFAPLNNGYLTHKTSFFFYSGITLPAKSMDYSENTMETLAFDILIYYEWLGINHK